MKRTQTWLHPSPLHLHWYLGLDMVSKPTSESVGILSQVVQQPLTWCGHTVIAVELDGLDVVRERFFHNDQCEIVFTLFNKFLIRKGFSPIITWMDVYLRLCSKANDIHDELSDVLKVCAEKQLRT